MFAQSHRRRLNERQFSLATVFEYMTLCAVLSALASITGSVPSVCLMGMALALAFRFGFAALLLLMLALISADCSSASRGDFSRELVVLVLASLVCVVSVYRRRVALGQSGDFDCQDCVAR
jgi:hypothetical protein